MFKIETDKNTSTIIISKYRLQQFLPFAATTLEIPNIGCSYNLRFAVDLTDQMFENETDALKLWTKTCTILEIFK